MTDSLTKDVEPELLKTRNRRRRPGNVIYPMDSYSRDSIDLYAVLAHFVAPSSLTTRRAQGIPGTPCFSQTLPGTLQCTTSTPRPCQCWTWGVARVIGQSRLPSSGRLVATSPERPLRLTIVVQNSTIVGFDTKSMQPTLDLLDPSTAQRLRWVKGNL